MLTFEKRTSGFAQCAHNVATTSCGNKKGTLAVVLSDLFLSQTPISAQYGVGHKHFFSNRLAKFLLDMLGTAKPLQVWHSGGSWWLCVFQQRD